MSASRDSTGRSTLFILLSCFFLSGTAGLIYQVAWTKALGLVFGHTVYAIATVLAAFMGGLAAGSAFLGRWGERQARPVALYGWIELLIGLTGALSLLGLGAVRILYLAAYDTVAGWMPFLVGLRFVGCILVLFLPTFLMGGTLPILTHGVTRNSAELGSRLGRLYWVNTAGAVAGALAAGFFLLPSVGLRLTVILAALLNVIAGCLALTVRTEPSELPSVERHEKPAETVAKVPRFLLVGFGVVGATAMAYEIAWTRLLATTLASSTYAFTVMLATFLAGIAIGSRLFESWVSRGREVSLTTFSMTQTLTGLAGFGFLALYRQLPTILWALISATNKSFGGLVLAQFATCALAMLPGAIIFGFNFPVVTVLIAGRSDPGAYSAAVGRACAANTFGAIVGAIAAGFWLVPLVGSFRLVAMIAAANILLAVFLEVRREPRRTAVLAGNAVLAIVIAVIGWRGLLYDPAITNFNAITDRKLFPQTLKVSEIAHRWDLLFSEDGLNATITVLRKSNWLGIRTNGKTDASTGDKVTQLMLGHLGMLFHQAPKKVLVIGFGGGMTVSAVARYPEVQQIDCVEIEPAVIRAASHLEPLNRGVLRDPRLHIILDDARNFLFTTRNQYDLIISEPSNLWIAGIASLFTDEFYHEVRSRLAPGGMLVQWMHAYGIYPQDMKMLLGTLGPNFPQVTVWHGQQWDTILLAQTEPGPLALDRLRRFWAVPNLRSDYEDIGLRSPESLIAFHVLDDPDFRNLIANAPRNTDDLTRLEYRAPLGIFAELSDANNIMMMLAQHRSQLLPASIPITDERAALSATADTLMGLKDYGSAALFLNALRNEPLTAEGEVLQGKWLLVESKFDDARDAFEAARRLDPSSVAALLGLAEAARHKQDYRTAENLLGEVLARHPQFAPALESYALLERSKGDWARAIELQTKRIETDPSPPPESLGLLADLFLRAGEDQKAERVYTELLDLDSYSGDAHRSLGEIYRREKRWEDARVHLEAVVRFYPSGDPGQYISLADVYRNLGRTRDEESTLRKGQRIFPGNASLVAAVPGD